MSLFQEYANRHGLCQVCEFKLADCICNRKMEPLRKPTEPPASDPPGTELQWYARELDFYKGVVEQQKLTIEQAASSHTELRTRLEKLVQDWYASDACSEDPYAGGAFRRCGDELKKALGDFK